MATQTLKILGQSNPSTSTETTLYTVPAATTASVSSVVICNQGASNTTFRLSISLVGAATALKDYLYYEMTLAANDTFIATVGLTMGATDVMRVYTQSSLLSFSAYGAENA